MADIIYQTDARCREVNCDHCGAGAGEECVTARGRRAPRYHAVRARDRYMFELHREAPEIREDHHVAPEPPEEPPYCDRCGGYHGGFDCPRETATCDGCGDEFDVDELEAGFCVDCDPELDWEPPVPEPDPDTLAENAAHYEEIRQDDGG